MPCISSIHNPSESLHPQNLWQFWCSVLCNKPWLHYYEQSGHFSYWQADGLLNSSSTSKLVWGCVRAGRWEQEELNRIELLEDLEKMSDSIMPSFISDPPSVKVTRMRGKPCQCHGFPFILDFLSFWFLVQLRSSGECFINFINTSLVFFF